MGQPSWAQEKTTLLNVAWVTGVWERRWQTRHDDRHEGSADDQPFCWPILGRRLKFLRYFWWLWLFFVVCCYFAEFGELTGDVLSYQRCSELIRKVTGLRFKVRLITLKFPNKLKESWANSVEYWCKILSIGESYVNKDYVCYFEL